MHLVHCIDFFNRFRFHSRQIYLNVISFQPYLKQIRWTFRHLFYDDDDSPVICIMLCIH